MYTIQTSPERKLKLCALPTCKGKRYDLVHKFPMNNERAQQWIDIINLPEIKKLPIEQIRKRFFICSKHFRPQDYKNCESRSLNTTAYPRLLLKLSDEQASTEQCPTNANVEEVDVQESDYGIEEATVSVTNTMAAEKTTPKSIEYILGVPTNDEPVLLQRDQNNETTIVIQKPFQIQTHTVIPEPKAPSTASTPAPKPIILRTSLKPVNVNISAPKLVPSKTFLKRNTNYTIESVRKKVILNESDAPQIAYPPCNQKG